MASKLSLTILAITVASLATTLVVSLSYGEQLAGRLTDQGLDTQLKLKADQVTRFLGSLDTQVSGLVRGDELAAATLELSDAFAELGGSPDVADPEAAANVDAFYRDRFAPQLEATAGATVSWPSLRPTTAAGTYLQDLYVATDATDPAERRLVNDADDGSTWSAVHRDLHPRLLEITERLGFDDLYLIDPESGSIVYSTAKLPDFATSLDSGPYSGGTLAGLMRRIRDSGEPASAVFADIAPHTPAGGVPVAFIGGPLHMDDMLSGILIVTVPTDAFDQIMTSGGAWDSVGLGETGETFLFGADGRMRSVSRAFVEDQRDYLDAVAAAGSATPEEVDAMAGLGTTISFQNVVGGATIDKIDANPEIVVEDSNYLGREVSAAYQAVGAPGVTWFVGAQIGREEVVQPITDFRRSLLIAIAVFVVLITFWTVGWARSVFRPLRAIGSVLRRVRDGETTEGLGAPASAPVEFVELTQSIDQMLEETRLRHEKLAAATATRLETMRSFLPAAVADRMEAGDRRVLDELPQATIVVIVVDGLGSLVQSIDVDETRRQLDLLVGALDGAARRRGLEPVKLIGDAYFAGCGLSQPFLDHAPRAVAFALDARDIVRDLVSADGVASSAGVHSGPVTVGLTGSALLVYDLWGATAGTAQLLARSAQPGQILVSNDVKAMLPASIAVESRGNVADGLGVWEVSHRDRAGEAAT